MKRAATLSYAFPPVSSPGRPPLALALLVSLLLPPLAGPLSTARAQALSNPAGPSFAAMDRDKSGHVTLEEVLAHAKKSGAGVQPFRITDADLDHDGRLTVEEQRKAGINGLEQYGPIDLKELDKNGDGYVSREDIDEYFRNRHREAYARADANKDNALHPSEFALFRF